MLDPDYALFVEVAAAGSLSAAARTRGLSPAMVSKRLARLEARLGVTLMHRTTRRLALTAAGARFRDDLVAVLALVEAAEAQVTGTRSAPAGVLRVSAPTSFGRLHLAPHLPTFLDRHPLVRLEIDLTDAYVDVIADRIDVAVRIAARVPSTLVAHRLGDSRRILCASPAYLESRGTPAEIGDLTRHRLLAATGQLPWRLSDGRQRRTIAGESHVRTNSSEVVRELAIVGGGIALRSLWDVADAIADGRLIRVLSPWGGGDDTGIYALHPHADRQPPAVAAFVTFLQEIV